MKMRTPEFMRGAVSGYKLVYAATGLNELGEVEREISDKLAIDGGVVLDWKGEPGETGKLKMSDQGLEASETYRLYALATSGIVKGDDLEIGGKIYRVGHVSSYESHIEATVFEYGVAE